jgi:hypothetical protein
MKVIHLCCQCTTGCRYSLTEDTDGERGGKEQEELRVVLSGYHAFLSKPSQL